MTQQTASKHEGCQLATEINFNPIRTPALRYHMNQDNHFYAKHSIKFQMHLKNLTVMTAYHCQQLTMSIGSAMTHEWQNCSNVSTNMACLYLAKTFPLPPGNVYGCWRRKTCPTRLHGMISRDPWHCHTRNDISVIHILTVTVRVWYILLNCITKVGVHRIPNFRIRSDPDPAGSFTIGSGRIRIFTGFGCNLIQGQSWIAPNEDISTSIQKKKIDIFWICCAAATWISYLFKDFTRFW